MEKENFLISSQQEEELYKCPNCRQVFKAFTIITTDKNFLISAIPDYCIYCGEEMEKYEKERKQIQFVQIDIPTLPEKDRNAILELIQKIHGKCYEGK